MQTQKHNSLFTRTFHGVLHETPRRKKLQLLHCSLNRLQWLHCRFTKVRLQRDKTSPDKKKTHSFENDWTVLIVLIFIP